MRKYLVCVLGVMIFFLTIGCTQESIQQPKVETQQSTDEPTEKVTDQPSEDSVDLILQGTVINSQRVDNENGGYYVPIPDSWQGKVSYEIKENEIIFYHITKEGTQQAANPLIMIVGASFDTEPTLIYPSAEVFLELDDVQFYSCPPLDYPYEIGSADGDVYELLLADVPQVLQSIWVIDESKWADLTGEDLQETNGAMPFSKEDAVLWDAQLGDNKDKVLEMLGSDFTLNNIEDQTWEATSEQVEIYNYDSFSLTFVDGKFSRADVQNPILSGPRGFSIACDIDDIIASFADSVEYESDDKTVFYSTNGADDDMIIAPYCVLYEYEQKTLSLACFEEENLVNEVDLDELKEFHIYEVHYSCSFTFDENDKVVSFSLYYGPFAE